MYMSKNILKFFSGLFLSTLVLIVTNADAAISFVSATNSASLVSTVDEGSERIFIFGGIASGEATTLSFTTDAACPGVAMTGGAEFTASWSCSSGVISATVTNRGGMSFGPSTDGNAGTFYVTFSNPPTPPGYDSAPTALSGIQISVFGDVSSWNLSGEPSTGGGVTFGVELSGTKGGEANFRMDLPAPAVTFLGGVLGVFVGGKADPFATVNTNSDGSVGIKVDIASLSSDTASSSSVGTNADLVTKKITAGARSLSVGFNKTSVKKGKSVSVSVCSGTEFTAGDKVAVKFTVGGKATKIDKTLKLDSQGCAKSSVSTKTVSVGTLTAKVSYKGKKASGKMKVTK